MKKFLSDFFKNEGSKIFQPFYLVTVSPWPLLMSFGLMSFLLSVLIMVDKKIYWLLILNFFFVLLIMYQWFRDVVRESSYLGEHSALMMVGMKLGMFLFILSEVFFFISFFWSYFHFSLSPEIELGMNWPPMGLKLFNPLSLPFINTVILLCSGVTLTWSHHSLLISGKGSFFGLFLTIILGLIFIFFQMIEYFHAGFTMSDSCYGSIFFMTTGFHGLHVMMGIVFMMVMLIRMILGQFSCYHHLGFEFSCWYWHFVDVVWLFLYLFVYFWVY